VGFESPPEPDDSFTAPSRAGFIPAQSVLTHMADLLSDDAIEARLPEAWHRDGDEIVRVYEFDDYLEGVSFAATAGEIAEEEWHHPTIEIRYGEVEIRLTSHEEGGITDQDIHVAELFDEAR